MVSDAFLQHAYMRTELSEVNEFYHALARKAIGEKPDEADYDLYRHYRGLSIFYLENFVSRISDFFDIYIEHLIYAVALERDDFIPEKLIQKTAKWIEEMDDSDPSDDDILFEASLTLGKKNKSELAGHFEDKTGFKIESASPFWEDALLCNKIRNLIVHRSSTMDYKFVAFARRFNCPFPVEVGSKLILPEKWLVELASNVDECIYAVDHQISDFVPIHKRDRYGHFWLPRSEWANPLGPKSTNNSPISGET